MCTHTHFFCEECGQRSSRSEEVYGKKLQTDLKSGTGALSKKAEEARNSCALKRKRKST